jgi:hypothetical protein
MRHPRSNRKRARLHGDTKFTGCRIAGDYGKRAGHLLREGRRSEAQTRNNDLKRDPHRAESVVRSFRNFCASCTAGDPGAAPGIVAISV